MTPRRRSFGGPASRFGRSDGLGHDGSEALARVHERFHDWWGTQRALAALRDRASAWIAAAGDRSTLSLESLLCAALPLPRTRDFLRVASYIGVPAVTLRDLRRGAVPALDLDPDAVVSLARAAGLSRPDFAALLTASEALHDRDTGRSNLRTGLASHAAAEELLATWDDDEALDA